MGELRTQGDFDRNATGHVERKQRISERSVWLKRRGKYCGTVS